MYVVIASTKSSRNVEICQKTTANVDIHTILIYEGILVNLHRQKTDE